MIENNISVERDFFGTLHIKVGDFDYVQIQYQHPYTDNASTRSLAHRIVALLAQPAEQQPAPDVARLVEVLECARKDLSDWITSFPEAAHAHTTIVIARIDAALAAYRKQETSHDNQ